MFVINVALFFAGKLTGFFFHARKIHVSLYFYPACLNNYEAVTVRQRPASDGFVRFVFLNRSNLLFSETMSRYPDRFIVGRSILRSPLRDNFNRHSCLIEEEKRPIKKELTTLMRFRLGFIKERARKN